METTAHGLEGIIVADTRLSHVDGEGGVLVVAGHAIEALAGEVSFESAIGLLLDGALPDVERLATLRTRLAAARAEAFAMLGALGDALTKDDPMDALRAAVAHLPAAPDHETTTLRLVGAMATFAAAIGRTREGRTPIAPVSTHGHAADLLHMLGRAGSNGVRALDAYLVTVIDHGMNASTFAARVVTSTESDTVSAIVAGIGALKGRLHGGAPGPVLDMLDAVGDADAAEAYVDRELAAGRRIMGMGHRIYRVRDPRAAVLERAIERLARDGAVGARLALARAVESAATSALARRHPERPLRANVEFFTAVVLEAVGIPRALFTVTFACGRVVGWCAHVDEQRRCGRLIRPASRYVGPMP